MCRHNITVIYIQYVENVLHHRRIDHSIGRRYQMLRQYPGQAELDGELRQHTHRQVI